jgi:hypothetical protein
MCPFLSSFSQVKQERVGVVAVVEVGQRLRERCWSSLVKGVVMTQEKKKEGGGTYACPFHGIADSILSHAR